MSFFFRRAIVQRPILLGEIEVQQLRDMKIQVVYCDARETVEQFFRSIPLVSDAGKALISEVSKWVVISQQLDIVRDSIRQGATGVLVASGEGTYSQSQSGIGDIYFYEKWRKLWHQQHRPSFFARNKKEAVQFMLSNNQAVATLTSNGLNLENRKRAQHPQVEVEQKFVLNNKSQTTIKNFLSDIGATWKSTKTFCDVYFDTKDYMLSRQDYWLRQRDDAWELKMPLKKSIKTTLERGTTASVYREVLGREAVAKALHECLGLTDWSSLTELAIIKTHRTKYSITYANRTMGMDLDDAVLLEPNFNFSLQKRQFEKKRGGLNCCENEDTSGKSMTHHLHNINDSNVGLNCSSYCVGELEVLTTSDQDASVAKQYVQDVLLMLGLLHYDSVPSPVPGKLGVALFRHNRKAFEALCQANIFGIHYVSMVQSLK